MFFRKLYTQDMMDLANSFLLMYTFQFEIRALVFITNCIIS